MMASVPEVMNSNVFKPIFKERPGSWYLVQLLIQNTFIPLLCISKLCVISGTHTTPTITLRAQRYSYYDYTTGGPDPLQPTKKTKPMKPRKGKAGVSKGTAAAVAIILFLLAIALTVVVMHVVLKRRGVRLFQFARFQNEPTA